MGSKPNYAGLDYFKIVAAILVIAIHTGPLMTYNEYADFLLTGVLARLAVPFFFMASGFLLFRKLQDNRDRSWTILNRYVGRIAIIYIFAILVYLPLNVYAGHYAEGINVYSLLSDLIFNGTMYHLWYMPALIIGVYIVYYLSLKISMKHVLIITGLLYVIGLFGDSYYGLVEQVPIINSVYSSLFNIFDYTRNGLLFAPVFVALGLLAARGSVSSLGTPLQTTPMRTPLETSLGAPLQTPMRTHNTYAVYSVISLTLLIAEAHIVRSFELARHDSMYVMLLPTIYYLFQWLLKFKGSVGVYARHMSLWIYLLHPLAIVLIRGVGKLTGLDVILVTNSVSHYIAVTLLSLLLAAIVVRVRHVDKNKPHKHRAWSEVNLAHLDHNLTELKRVLPDDCQIIAVVKAEAYGHGSIEVAKRLYSSGVRRFAVADIDEAIILRKKGVKGDILVLGATYESRFGELVKYKLQQSVISAEYGECLNAYGRLINVHIKIDTGMNRLGECYSHLEQVIAMYGHPNLRVVGTYSHLAVSDSLEPVDVNFTHTQIMRFNQLVAELKSKGINPGFLHIQSSYGIMNYPDLNYDLARPGIALYGLLSREDEVREAVQLRPVLSLRARVVQVKDVCGNKPIGYGHDCLTTQDSKIAIISIGYADGLPRALSNNGGCVIIQGQKAPIMGRICMDHIMVDVTHIAEVKRGDIATLIGQDGAATISAEQVAELCGTITNDILSRIGGRIERLYLSY